MELYNSLSGQVSLFQPQDDHKPVRIYSCGPTVYERVHIGNLASFIYADTLRRVLEANKFSVTHVMNITDVDDKTIRASRKEYPDLPPMEALKKLTAEYEEQFKKDIEAVGIDTGKITFVRATEHIPQMQKLITDLVAAGFGYLADDGVYFSIEKYKAAGKKYGQLVNITASSTSTARIDNDDYDKDNIHDFALWKKQRQGEPAWDFEIAGVNMAGRPGWHIECSAMSVDKLGQPFDIHTGGVDLKFPHHENEIAQSTATTDDPLAACFFHNEHLHINEQKMSKSLGNVFSLGDVMAGGFDPLAFRLFVLEGKYNRQREFSWEILQQSANRLMRWRQVAGKWRQVPTTEKTQGHQIEVSKNNILNSLNDDLNTPEALERVDSEFTQVEIQNVQEEAVGRWQSLLATLDGLFGLKIDEHDESVDKLLAEREQAREAKNWQRADEIRQQLDQRGIGINDTEDGPIWYRK